MVTLFSFLFDSFWEGERERESLFEFCVVFIMSNEINENEQTLSFFEYFMRVGTVRDTT